MNLYKSYPTIELPTFLNPHTIRNLWEQWQAINHSKNRVVLLKGQTGKFCLGMDLEWVAKQRVKWADIESFIGFLKVLKSSPNITIAVVDGQVVGGGLGLVCACDFVIATNESSFRLTEGMMGLVPGVILPALLNRLNRQDLKKMVFSAQTYSDKAAREIGLVDEMATRGNLETKVLELIQQLSVSKKQSVKDLKMLLEKAQVPNPDLAREGALILQYRLASAGMKNRLTCIANLMKSITIENENGLRSTAIH